MPRPRVLLDCDCVLADTNVCILDFIHRHVNERFTLDMIQEWDAFQALGVPHLDEPWRQAVHVERMCSNLRPYAGARWFVDEVRKVADITIVTAPLKRCPSWEEQRLEWLKRILDIDSKDVVFTAEKHLYEGEVFIDDKLSNVVSWKDHNLGHGDALVWDAPWNRDSNARFRISGRVHSYEEALATVMEWA